MSDLRLAAFWLVISAIGVPGDTTRVVEYFGLKGWPVLVLGALAILAIPVLLWTAWRLWTARLDWHDIATHLHRKASREQDRAWAVRGALRETRK